MRSTEHFGTMALTRWVFIIASIALMNQVICGNATVKGLFMQN